MHISWDELQTIEALVRTGSVEAAGRELSLRHSSVSRRVAALEARLGTALFARGARLVPSALTLRIAERAAAMRVAARDIEDFVGAERRGRERTVVITTSDVLAPLLFLALAKARPAQAVEVLVSDDELELLPGQVDLALRPGQNPSGALRGRRLGRLKVGVYRARGGAPDWLQPSVELRARASMSWWREVPKDVPGAVTCSSLLAMRDACSAGLGRAALPAFLAHGDARLQFERELDAGPPLWLLAPMARGIPKELREVQRDLFAALRATEGAFVE
ncbi:LysR family transcriptional regulator [Myxococcus sp. CA051A]|uniref:LysR family transcriptional regulator n=1 Tax=Myxococcus sp. CA051A TaxID=2741739 RepID=UPI00157B7F97|nr:LysR family transcriptional regulator [Myxococcus sp. CA051A]NTX66092.1 LysR family transcriptional regulator [Myxococcus sp. CA051A]